MNGLLEITNDLFDIASRLKSVNKNYRLFYNKIAERYEVYDNSTRPSALAFIVPYAQLDARTVEYARFTAVQNAEKVFAEIEQHNAKLEKEQQKSSIDRIMSRLEGL